MARLDKVLAGEASWADWTVDQIGHAGLGTAYAIPPAVASAIGWISPCWAIAIGSALALFGGTLREFLQWKKAEFEPEKMHPVDRVVDALFHIPGGPIAVGLAFAVRSFV
jgi:hypothetical protein